MVHLKAKAPRLQAFLEKGIEHTVLITPREQWDLLNVGSTEMVEIDVRLCPISGVEQNAANLSIVAHLTYPSAARVSLYRYDEKDAPRDWNVDHYSVELDLASRQDLPEIINRASTSFDDNLCEYTKQNVFWVKEKIGDDHWLNYNDLPAVVKSIIKIEKST